MKGSHYISRKAGASILHAPRTAASIGRPLNWSVTINYWQFGIDATQIFDEFSALRERWFARWSRTKPKTGLRAGQPRNGCPTYIYVHEASKDLPHTHWVLYLEADLINEFEHKLRVWLMKRYGINNIPEGAVHVAEVTNAEGKKLYLAKGLDPLYAQLWGIFHESTGWIGKRRADCSRNLGPSVWKPLKEEYRRRKWAA